jgi:hypothetical protein
MTDEIERAEQKLKNALRDFEQANEALRKLTRQDTDATINRVLSYASLARRKLAEEQKALIDAVRWRLGR